MSVDRRNVRSAKSIAQQENSMKRCNEHECATLITVYVKVNSKNGGLASFLRHGAFSPLKSPRFLSTVLTLLIRSQRIHTFIHGSCYQRYVCDDTSRTVWWKVGAEQCVRSPPFPLLSSFLVFHCDVATHSLSRST